MFNTIATSESNKLVISSLTNKLALGPENVIARLAFSYSLSQGNKLDLKDIEDSKGKIYSAKVLFGNHIEIYLLMISCFYGIENNDKDIPKYVKLHIDHGLKEMQPYANSDGIDFIMRCIEDGLTEPKN